MHRQAALFALFLSAVLGAAPAVVTPRGGLPNLLRSYESGETVRMVAFGGTATASEGMPKGKDLPDRLSRALRKGFPKARFRVMKQGLPQTGSWLGAFRTDTEAIRHYVPLGVVVVEFAVDDANEPEDRVLAAVEGIVRKIRRAKPTADILFLHGARPEWTAEYQAGKTPATVAVYERIAKHYGIPTVNAGLYVAQHEPAEGEKLWENGKPTGRLLGLYNEAVLQYSDQLANATVPQKAVKHPLPKPLGPHPLEKAGLVTYERATLADGWLGWQESPLKRFFHVVHGTKPGAVMTLKFQGDAVGLYAPLQTTSANFATSLDGGEWKIIPRGTPGNQPRAEALVVGENLDPSATHELRVRLQPEDNRRDARLAFFLVDGKPIYDDPYAGLTPLQKLDAIYATMDPVTYQPAANRWQHIPKTMARLQDGPDLTVVMLGDSIVNDTANSQYQHLLMRRYPRCQVNVVRSVRGSTGCWWYKEDNRVQQYVLDHKPQLLMIGGISQRNDIDSIRETIRQVRAADPGIEVMLMTGCVGWSDPRTDPNWTYEVPAEGDSYRTRLRKLALEENCEFLDMTGPWGRYIRQAKHALGSFKRDAVHANDRGKQVLGRILDAYFAPKG
jgi:hypothetical protein